MIDPKKDNEDNKDDLFSNINPEELSPELKETYKSMQGDYTRKTQAIADLRKGYEDGETKFEEKLKQYGGMEQELEQWRKWYASLEDDTTVADPKTTPELDEPDYTVPDYLQTDNAQAKQLTNLQGEIDRLKGELTSVTDSIKDSTSRTNRMFNYQAQLEELGGKYENLDKQKLLKHALDAGQTDLEKAYQDLYRDDIIKTEVAKQLKEELAKHDTTGISTPGRQIVLKPSSDKVKTFADVSDSILTPSTG